MATVASLDIVGRADFSDLTRGLTRGAADIDKFGQRIVAMSQDLARTTGGFNQVGFLNDIIAELGLAGAGFRATSQEGKAFQAVIEQLRGEQDRLNGTIAAGIQEREAASASLRRVAEAETAALTQQATAADILIGKMGLLTRTATNARQALSAPSGPPVAPVPTLLASQDDTRFSQNAEKNAAAMEKMAAAQALAGQEAAVLSRETRANVVYSEMQALAAAQVAAATNDGTRAMTGHHNATRKATTAIAQLAATSIGAEGPVARLAEAGLLFGGGELAVVGFAGALLVLAGAYRFTTTAAREAREEQEKHVQGLLTESAQAIPATVRALEALTAARQAERNAREPLVSRATKASDAVGDFFDPLAHLRNIGPEFARRSAKEQSDALRAQRQAQDDLTKSVHAFEDTNVRAMTESIQLGIADNFLRAQAPGLVRLLRDRIADQATTTQEAAAAQQLLNGLIDAMSKQDVGDAFVQNLALQVALFGETELAAKKVAIALNADLTPAQKAQATALATTLDGMERQKKALEEHKKEIDALLKGATLPPIQEGLQQAVNALDVALKGPHPVEIFLDIGDADKQVADLLKKLQDKQKAQAKDRLGLIAAPANGVSEEFERAAASADDITDALTRAASASNAFFRRAVKDATDARTQFQRAADDVDQIGRAVNGLGEVASAFGDIGEQARQGLQGVNELFDGITAFASGDILGGVLGSLSGIANIGNALFSGDQEHERRLEDNTRALEHLTVVTGRQDQQLTAAAVNRGIDDALAAEAARPLGPKGVPLGSATDTANNALARSGLDLTDLAEIARRSNFEILDKNGNLDVEALKQFNDAVDSGAISLDQLVEASRKFGNSFSEQIDRLTLRDRLFGPTAANDADATRQRFTTELEALGNISPEVANKLKGIDTTTDAGREEFRKALQELFGEVDSGFFAAHPELFGGLTLEDFNRLLNDGADFLDSFNQGLDDATAALLNIPSGFKLALAEFNATTPLESAVPFPGSPVNDRAPVTAASGPSMSIGSIQITVDGSGLNADELADKVLDRFQRRATLIRGRTSDWSEIN